MCRARRGHRCLGHARAQGRRQRGRRAFLDHLLVPTLRRAVALEQVDHVAVIVGKNLDLDVARVRDQPFDVQRAVVEGGRRLAPRRLDRAVDRCGVVDLAHALAAAAGRRLDQRGQADALDRLPDAAVRLIVRGLAGHHRHAGRRHQPPRVDLRAHLRDHAGGRADEDQPVPGARGGERRILREKPVARVYGVGAGRARGLEQPRHREVAVVRRRRSDGDGPIRGRDVRRLGVGGGVHRDALDPELGAGADDADGNLAAVGNQQATDHWALHHGGHGGHRGSDPEGVAPRVPGVLCGGELKTSTLVSAFPGTRAALLALRATPGGRRWRRR